MKVVIDTNVVLDLFVFQDHRTLVLLQCLQTGPCQWIATLPMREELRLVLAYPHIAAKLLRTGGRADDVLARFDAWAALQPEAPKAIYTCKDADDQKFIDLAAAHQAALISKDKAILCMAKRLARLSVQVMPTFTLPLTAMA
jgi:putative PIN family toxin of toxin-antitoxin system